MPYPTMPVYTGAIPLRVGQEPAEFSENMGDMLTFIPTFSAGVDAAGAYMQGTVVDVEADRVAVASNTTIATAASASAAASAASALSSASTNSTSTTSSTIGTGQKTFTIQSGKNIVVGMFMTCAADSQNYMVGNVVSYTSTTLVLNVTDTLGSGTYTSWILALSAPPTTVSKKSVTLAAATNLLLYSKDFSNAAWTKIDLTATGGYPDALGGNDGFELSDVSGSLLGALNQSVVSTQSIGQHVCFSCYVKRGTSTGFTMRCLINGGDNLSLVIEGVWISDTSITLTDLKNTTSSNGLINFGYTVETGGWLRVYVVVQSKSGASTNNFGIRPTRFNTSYTGTTFVSHAQLETGKTTPSLYTPTTTVAATGGGVLSANICDYSEQFSLWTKIRLSVVANSILAPNGTLTADEIISDATVDQTHLISTNSSVFAAGSVLTYSVYFNPSLSGGIQIFPSVSSNGFRATFTPAGGIVSSGSSGTGTYISSGYKALANGWYRVWVTGKADPAATSIVPYLYMADSTGDASPAVATGVENMYLWGACLNVGYAPCDYVETPSTVAVNASAAVMVAQGDYLLDSTEAPLTISFPDAYENAEVSFVDVAGSAATNNITVNNNGALVMGTAEPFIINENSRPFNFKYTRQRGWVMR